MLRERAAREKNEETESAASGQVLKLKAAMG